MDPTEPDHPNEIPQSSVHGAFGPHVAMSGVHDLVVTEAYLRGGYVHHRWCFVPNVVAGAVVVPPDATVQRESSSRNGTWRLVTGPGYLAQVDQSTRGSLRVSVVARAAEVADAVAAWVDGLRAEPSVDPSTIDVTFTYGASHGAVRSTRRIGVPDWAATRRNYPGPVRRQCEDVLSFHPSPEQGGRLVLLHGPPGTGKTTFVRAIASTWRAWCDTEFIVDPERLFNDAAYLFEVVLGDDDDPVAHEPDGDDAPVRPRWRLFVLEDCDELLRADAKQATGQAMSRLLNVADGVLGQGRRVLILLSTNERLDRLHPAVRRPGRCLAEIDVRAFTRAEAAAWLGAGFAVPQGDVSLAELYALRSGVRAVDPGEPQAVGQYL